MHSEKSAILFSRMVCEFSTWARFESLGSGTQSDPAISSISNSDHDYVFELPEEPGAGCPIITSVIYCTPSRFPGSPACEPSFATGRSPSLGATSSTDGGWPSFGVDRAHHTIGCPALRGVRSVSTPAAESHEIFLIRRVPRPLIFASRRTIACAPSLRILQEPALNSPKGGHDAAEVVRFCCMKS